VSVVCEMAAATTPTTTPAMLAFFQGVIFSCSFGIGEQLCADVCASKSCGGRCWSECVRSYVGFMMVLMLAGDMVCAI
jgi:hypothetical protein